MSHGARFIASHHERIRRIVQQRCARLCRDRAWDVDDLVHDVILALARKQESRRSRYDPARSAVSTYVVRVTNGVVGHRLARCRVEMGSEVEADEDGASAPDESGLDDLEAQRLGAVLQNAADVLGGHDAIAYRTLVAWLMHDRDAAAISRVAHLRELDVWRYVERTLTVLRRYASQEWRAVWWQHREYCARRKRSARDELERSERDDIEAFALRAHEGTPTP